MRYGYRSRVWLCAAVTLLLATGSHAQDKPAIIDVHIHAMPAPLGYPICPLSGLAETKQPDGSDVCAKPFLSPASAEALRRQTLEVLRRHNVLAVISGPDLSVVEAWRKEQPEKTLPALQTTGDDLNLASLRRMLEAGSIAVIGEVTAQYKTLPPNDPKLEPLYALAEEFDVPVGIHIAGIGAPTPTFRAALGDPLLLEPVLVKHPKLRVYVMHAGFPFLDRMVSLLRLYPNVYVDIGWIDWHMPRTVFHAYLKGLVEQGFEKRIMFGTDQVSWPQAIELAIDGVRSAGFLTEGQKQDIFYNNAARFLRLQGKAHAKPPSRSEEK